jgi:hypothetical protein
VTIAKEERGSVEFLSILEELISAVILDLISEPINKNYI